MFFKKKGKFNGNQFVKMGTYKIVRRKRSFWGRVLDQIKNFLRKLGIIVLLVMVAWAIVEIIHYAYPNITYRVVEKEVVLDNLQKKIDQLKGELINDIYDHERAGHTEEDALITWDPNPKNKKVQIASIGSCQFKVSTVQYYSEKLYGKKMTNKEAVMLALDDQKCKALMSEVIFKEPNGWSNWYNASIKYNAKSRLAVINELEK